MKLLNAKFNVGDIIKPNPVAIDWYKTNFPKNIIIDQFCNTKFIIWDVVRYMRSGEYHLYVQNLKQASMNPNTEYVIFTMDKSGHSTDPNLCWFNFNEPLFIRSAA